MHFDIAELTPHQVYNMLIGLIAPRPIALVTSKDLQGRLNAAPFSSYNYVAIDPPIVALGVANRPGDEIIGKDTARNIRNTHEFVVNVVDEAIMEAMNVCAIDFPPGVDELKEAGLTTIPSTKISVPRIAEAPASLECREFSTTEIGRSRIILGEVLAIHIRDEFVDLAGPYVKTEELHQVGRMNGRGAYVRTRGSFFYQDRIPYENWQKQKENG